MPKIKFESKNNWIQDEYRKYLWIHDSQPIQAMVFTNDDEDDIKCIWVKIQHEQDFVSNYFVYSTKEKAIHPLDYTLELVQLFKESEDG